jgi:hypothetical protein
VRSSSPPRIDRVAIDNFLWWFRRVHYAQLKRGNAVASLESMAEVFRRRNMEADDIYHLSRRRLVEHGLPLDMVSTFRTELKKYARLEVEIAADEAVDPSPGPSNSAGNDDSIDRLIRNNRTVDPSKLSIY